MHSQVHDIRRHIQAHHARSKHGKEAMPSQSVSDFEVFYSPVCETLTAPQITHTPNNTILESPVTIPLHSPLWISNVLAVVICIAEYDDNSSSPDIESSVDDLHGIEKDWLNLHAFFEYLNYAVIPGEKEHKLWWTEEKLVQFLRNDIGEALFGGTDTLQYDALIVCISCHGLKNTVITSDLKLIEKEALHRLVSLYDPKVRDIPRLFLIDACDGPAERRRTVVPSAFGSPSPPVPLPMTVLSLSMKKGDSVLQCTLSRRETVKKGTKVNALKLKTLNNTETVQQWTTTTTNPDYNLAVVYAANTGFQAKIRGDIGSYFITLFIDKIKENIQRKQGKRLADVCHEIQEHLHSEGKQLPKPVFYGDTRNIMLKRNKSGVTIGVGI